MKNILVLQDNYESYLTLIGCVMQNKPIDMILQQEPKSSFYADLVTELNQWLKKKKFPHIRTHYNELEIIETIEEIRDNYFQSFPNDLFNKIQKTSGLLVECDQKNLNLTSCIEDWGWDDESVINLVINFSDVPENARQMIDSLSCGKGFPPSTCAHEPPRVC